MRGEPLGASDMRDGLIAHIYIHFKNGCAAGRNEISSFVVALFRINFVKQSIANFDNVLSFYECIWFS